MHCIRQRIFCIIFAVITLPLLAQVPNLPFAQSRNSNVNELYVLSHFSNSVNVVQAGLTNISTNLTGLRSDLLDFRKESKTTFWENLLHNVASSWIYDAVFKRDSTPGLIAKWSPIIGFGFLILRIIYFFRKQKNPQSKAGAAFQILLNVYLVFLMLFALKIFWSQAPSQSAVQSIDLSQLERKIETLSDGVARAQKSIEDGMRRAQMMPSATTNVPPEVIQAMSQTSRHLSEIIQQLSQTTNHITLLDSHVQDVESEMATDGHQLFQTLLLLGILICALGPLIRKLI